MANRFTEGLKQLPNGLYRLKEEVMVSKDTILEKLSPSKLTESVGGKELPIFGKYTIKVWDLDNLNKNKRNYADVVDIALQVPTTDGLANHPEDDEWDVTKTFAVETNPRIIDNWLCCDITLVGELGRLAESILYAGGQLRFSSSAQGDVGSSGNVLREGFILERFADWVANPSSGVFNYLEDMREQKSNKKYREETTKENVTILKEDIQEKKRMENKLQESLERIMAQNINGMFKTLETEPSIIEKKNLLEQIIQESGQLSDKTLLEKAQKRKAEVEKELEEKAKKAEEVDEVKEEIKKKEEEAEEKNEKIQEMREAYISLQKKYKALAEMYETKQYSASLKESSLNQSLSNQIKLLRQSNRALKEKIQADEKAFIASKKKIQEKAEYFEALANTKIDSSEVIKLREENKELKQVIDINQDKLREAHKVINEQKLHLSETRKQALRNRITESEKPSSLRQKFSSVRPSVKSPVIKENYDYEENSRLSSMMDAKDKERLVESNNDYIGFATKASDLQENTKVTSEKKTLSESWDGYDEDDGDIISKLDEKYTPVLEKNSLKE